MTGNQLKERRVALNLRQEDLARELKVVVSSVARWEQLKDQEIPNSKMLEIALGVLTGNFLIYNLNTYDENVFFSKENQLYLNLLPQLNGAIDSIMRQIKPQEENEIVVYMLGRLCVRHYQSILLLCSNGHGFAAMRNLRSLFEKSVDAVYLNNHPDEVKNFINFHLVNLQKTGFAELGKKLDPNYETIISEFKTGSKTKHASWSTLDLISRASSVNVDPVLVNVAYRMSNEFVHTSMSEILLTLKQEKDGSLIPNEMENDAERHVAGMCFKLATILLTNLLKVLVGAFELVQQPVLDKYDTELNEVFSWGKEN